MVVVALRRLAAVKGVGTGLGGVFRIGEVATYVIAYDSCCVLEYIMKDLVGKAGSRVAGLCIDE